MEKIKCVVKAEVIVNYLNSQGLTRPNGKPYNLSKVYNVLRGYSNDNNVIKAILRYNSKINSI